MTPLDRALNKAYGIALRPPAPAVEPNADGAALRGWVDGLIPPKRQEPTSPAWWWPSICGELLAATGPAFERLANQLRNASLTGKCQSIAFSSAGPMSGATSIVLTLARVLAADGKMSVLIVDCDVDHPSVGRRLGLGIPPARNQPVPGAATVSANMRDMALVPLEGSSVSILTLFAAGLRGEGTPVDSDIAALFQNLRVQFDLIVVDAGSWASPETQRFLNSSAVDAQICVRRASDDRQLDVNARTACQSAGVDFLGVIETFADAA